MSWKNQSSRSNTGKNTFINNKYSLSSNLNSENSRILGKGLFDNDVDICGNLTVGGELNVPTMVVINFEVENLEITNKLDISGGANIQNKLDVSGNVDISNNLFVGGNLDISGGANIQNKLDVSGNVDISYNLFVGGNLDVSGDVVFRNKLDVSCVDISNNLSVAGKLFSKSQTITVGPVLNISSTSAPGTVYNPEKSTILLECSAGPSTTYHWDLSNYDSSYQKLNIFYDNAQNPGLGTQINFGTDNLASGIGLTSHYLLSTNGQSLSIMSPFSGAEREEGNGKWRVVNSYVDSSACVLEEFELLCQGQTISTIKGNVTIEGGLSLPVTPYTLTNSWTDLSGATIEYTPPDGTTQVIYEFTMAVQTTLTATAAEYKFFIDGVEQTVCRNAFFNHGDMEIVQSFPISIGHPLDPSSCTVPDWTTSKTLKLQARSNNMTTYTSVLFQSGFLVGNGAPVFIVSYIPPMIKITAMKSNTIIF